MNNFSIFGILIPTIIITNIINVEMIKEASDKLTKVFYEVSEKLYSQAGGAAGAAGANGAANGTQQGGNNNGGTTEAEYKVENDGDNK